MSSFSDVPLEIPEDAPTVHDTFESKYVTRYLEEYVDSHFYNGTPLRSRIRLNAEVRSVEKLTSGWILYVGDATGQQIRCSKLAVAAGLTSLPTMPSFPRSPDWVAPIVHHRDFGMHSDTILAPTSDYKNVSVLGGGKSAADLVYASAKAGKSVNWIIRTTGEGPGIFMDPTGRGRYRNAVEEGATQKSTMLSPSSFRPLPQWAQSLHQSVSERATLLEKLYAADNRYKARANYRTRKGALPGFCDLEPSAS